MRAGFRFHQAKSLKIGRVDARLVRLRGTPQAGQDVRKPLRLSVTDCGISSRKHVSTDADVEAVEFTSANSRDAPKIEAFADESGMANRVTDWREMIASGAIDAVVICFPDGLHLQVTLEAAKHGNHVLVVKPMANNLAESRSMVETADEAGVVLMVAQMVRQLSTSQGLDPGRANRFCLTRDAPAALAAGTRS